MILRNGHQKEDFQTRNEHFLDTRIEMENGHLWIETD